MKFLFTFLIPIHLFCVQIAVVTMAVGKEYEVACYPSTVNKLVYSQKHGYGFHYANQSLDPTRPIPWSKIKLIEQTMDTGNYDWIFWTDADSMVTNMDIELESLIDDNFDIIISRDPYSINSGQFLIKCSNWSKEFLKAVYSHSEFTNHVWWEQKAIIFEYDRSTSVRERFKLLDQRAMNSYMNNWQKGDFIIHFAGGGLHGLYDRLMKYR